MAHLTRQVMRAVGIKPERFSLEWASAAEAPLYVELITKYTNQMKELGPLGEAEGIPLEELKVKLSAGKAAVEGLKLRTRFARLTQTLRKEGKHTADIIEEKMADKINEAIIKEVEKQEKAISEGAAKTG